MANALVLQRQVRVMKRQTKMKIRRACRDSAPRRGSGHPVPVIEEPTNGPGFRDCSGEVRFVLKTRLRIEKGKKTMKRKRW